MFSSVLERIYLSHLRKPSVRGEMSKERKRKREGKCTQVHGHTTCGPGIIIIVAYVTCMDLFPVRQVDTRQSHKASEQILQEKLKSTHSTLRKKSISGKSNLHRQVQNENAQDVKGG